MIAQELIRVTGNKCLEPHGRREPEVHGRMLGRKLNELSHRTGCHNEHQVMTYREREKPGFRCLDQLAIGDRTGTALAILERLVFKPERAGEFNKVGLLVHDPKGGHDAIGADPGRDGAPLHSRQHVAREQPAQAIKFRTGAGRPKRRATTRARAPWEW